MMGDRSFREELKELDEKGLRRRIRRRAGLVNFSSNDYLGLAHDEDVLSAAARFLSSGFAGGTSSRLLAGTHPVHDELEIELAAFLGKESVRVFASGYHANTGVLPALAGPGDVIFFDRLSHASLIDGIRLSGARFYSFDHNSADHLESLLRRKRPRYRRAFVVSEGVFSMDGDFPILPEIVFLAKRWETLVYLDEAHSLGLFGPEGRGMAASLELLKDVDIFVGTLSKTLGSQGGFAATRLPLADLIVSKSRSFIYSTALAPVNAASALAALRRMRGMDRRREKLQTEARTLRTALRNMGFDTLQSRSQVIPVWTGGVSTTKKFSEYLLDAGFFVPSIRPPTVPRGEGRIRLSLTWDRIQTGLAGLTAAIQSYPERPKRSGEKIAETV